MNINKHFGKALKSYLENRGTNKSWLAREMNVKPQSITSIFNVESPRQDTKRNVLNALKITEEELFLEEENRDMVPRKDYQKLLEENNKLLEEVALYRLEKINRLETEKIQGGSPLNKTSTSY